MNTVERIEGLRETIRGQEDTVRDETERILCLRERCAKSAELICRLNVQTVKAYLKYSLKCTMTEREADKLRTLEENEKIWPHIRCRIQINLRKQLWETQIELKGLENKMLDGTRAQIRKWAVQMEEMKQLRERMEQALLSLESWETLYLMFMEDMDIRRHSGMDEQFYQMELQDIKQKMNTCNEFYDRIVEPIKEELLYQDQALINKLIIRNNLSEKQFVLDHGNGKGEKLLDWVQVCPKNLKACASLSEEIAVEIRRYGIGMMFLEDHLYKRERAKEEKEAAERTLSRLTDEYELEKRRIAHMQFAY